MMTPYLPILLLIAGCSSGIVGVETNTQSNTDTNITTDSETETDSDTGSVTHSDTDTGGDTGKVVETGVFTPTFDCGTIPEPPFTATRLNAPRGYNDLVFDADGAMIGSDNNSLIKATSPDDSEVFAPSIGRIYKMGYLPSGDIVATTSDRSIISITPDGTRSVLVGDFNGYGIAVGSDGMIYAGTNYNSPKPEIIRVDPASGKKTQLIDATDFAPRGLEFSHDYSTLYFGTTNNGHVYRVPLDKKLNPTDDPELLITMPTSWHDTVEVDACGNLYIGTFFGHQIYRVNTDLSVTQILAWNFDNYGHGFEWGSAVGGWDDHSIYVTHPYVGTWVDQIELGVPGRQWSGEVIGRVTL
jgi:sugar lactone lactonase YvrE